MVKKQKKRPKTSPIARKAGNKRAKHRELDELEALRLRNAAYEAENQEIQKILGDEYVGLKNVVQFDEMAANAPSDMPIPSWSKKARVERALELNRRLKKRVMLLLKTIDQSRVSHDSIEQMIDHTLLEKKKRKEAAPHTMPSSRKLEYTGSSWFWISGTCENLPKYNNVNEVLFIASHLPLVNKSGAWSKEESESLKCGVEEIAKERMTNELIASVDTIEDFDLLQQPLRSLSLESPEILSLAKTFSSKEWSTLASRHIPSRTPIECLLQWKNKTNPLLKYDAFSSDEVRLLMSQVDKFGEHAWVQVAEKIQGRTPLDCLRRYEQIRREYKTKDRNEKSVWTDHDMKRLHDLVLKHGQAWKKIDSEFGGTWGGDKLMHIWRKHLQATGAGKISHKKGPWSKSEDELLLKAVAVGGKEWSKISTLIPGRTEMQCRERYVNHLDPNIKNSIPFTEEENAIVAREVPKYAHTIAWSKIAQLLPGRTDRQCRKAWQKMTRKMKKDAKQSQPNK